MIVIEIIYRGKILYNLFIFYLILLFLLLLFFVLFYCELYNSKCLFFVGCVCFVYVEVYWLLLNSSIWFSCL